MDFANNNFDAVILGELIEHVAYPEELIKKTSACLKKNGIMVITTPNNHLFSGLLLDHHPKLFSNIDEKDRKELSKRQFGPAGSDHLFVFDIKSLINVIKEQGLKVLDAGYVNSCFINQFTYPFLRICPKSMLHFFNNVTTKIPYFNKKLCLGLYAIAKNG